MVSNLCEEHLQNEYISGHEESEKSEKFIFSVSKV